MYKIMIVDDETAIRNGLRTIIDWEDLGIEVAGEAANGKQALALIDHFQPHILLTDIKMPEMDGIELLKNVTIQYPSIKVAVLSGFNDFSYVRSAMKTGAVNYLLKPVDTQELISAMKEIIGTIERSVKSSIEQREFIHYLQRNTLNRIITNGISLKEFREKCDILNISLNSSKMFVCLISIKISSDDSWELYAASNIFEEIISNSDKCYVFTDDHNNVVLLFKDTPVRTIELLLQTCLEKLLSFLDNHGVAAIGELATSHRLLSKSYDTAIKLLNYQLVYGADRIFSYEKYNTSSNDGSIPLLFTNFASTIEKWDKEGIKDNIDNLFSEVENGNYSVVPDTFKYSIIDIMSFVLYRLTTTGLSPEFLQKTKDSIYDRLQNITTQDELKSLLYDFSMSIVSKLSDNYSNYYSYYVKTVIDYIDDKYYDINISLKTMSNLIGVNAAYLGRLFKHETGGYFSDYLNGKRISEASRLLQSTYMKANDVSKKVGFSSISYFYTIFKKITGQNPGEIRK